MTPILLLAFACQNPPAPAPAAPAPTAPTSSAPASLAYDCSVTPPTPRCLKETGDEACAAAWEPVVAWQQACGDAVDCSKPEPAAPRCAHVPDTPCGDAWDKVFAYRATCGEDESAKSDDDAE